ncbi:MAG: hypothetical protein DRO11_04510 [Methanobacteriota archaeon]|nr:MAG: hypothetical protein DRO11_04510 [Euryarchaeota archaeon]
MLGFRLIIILSAPNFLVSNAQTQKLASHNQAKPSVTSVPTTTPPLKKLISTHQTPTRAGLNMLKG